MLWIEKLIDRDVDWECKERYVLIRRGYLWKLSSKSLLHKERLTF
jgi:hypothetical protein